MAAKLCKRDGYGPGGGLTLPEDMMLEVVFRLPAKALCQFQCVSRSWRALISSPAFVAMQRSRSSGTLIIIAVFGDELRLLDKGGNVLMVFNVWGSRVLLAPTRLDHILINKGQLGATIINPASGEFTSASMNDVDPSLPSGANSDMMSDYSFGRARASGDYKVLRLTTSSPSSSPSHDEPTEHPATMRCQVATIVDGVDEPTWRQRPWGPFSNTSFSCEDKATINGVLYFMLDYLESDCRNFIAAFDLESEEWNSRRIEGPLLGHNNNEDKWRITLTELRGTLCMVHNVQYIADLVGHNADIWLLKDPIRCVWVKEYKIKMPDKRFLLFTKPLDVLTDGKLLLLNEFRKPGNAKNCHQYILQLYNSSTKAFTNFMEMGPGFNGGVALYTGKFQA